MQDLPRSLRETLASEEEMTKHEVLHTYDRSVYQIRLEVATKLFTGGYTQVHKCLELADKFVEELLKEDIRELTSKFN